MNKQLVFHYLSKILLLGSLLFLLPMVVSLYYHEQKTATIFLIVGVGTAIAGVPLTVIPPKNKHMYDREALVIVALMWVVYPIVGALPFWLSGEIPHFVDAVFESVSGFTTTGSTILTDVEALSRGMLFYRSLTHWVGGMGVLVLAIAILPSSNDALTLMRAECAGPQVSKIVPKGKWSAAYLYIIYTVLTIITAVLLIAGGMPLFDSVCHAMGTAGTGGFGIKNDGVAFYNSSYIDAVITIMMALFGVNFSLYYYIIAKRLGDVWKNTEIKVYFIIMAVATGLIMIDIRGIYHSFSGCLRYAGFQVSSIMTSTGFATADYTTWPGFSQMILVILMFIGACGGSTGGGFKVARVIILFKNSMRSLRKMLSPNSVNVVKSDSKTMDVQVVHSIQNYLSIYIGLLIVSLLFVAIDNADFSTTFSSVTTCINNIGPGLNRVGPLGNFSFYSDTSKITLTLDMLLGRLECLPMLILFSPSAWRRNF
ncbi:MAG: TrkH family potassium uptake protein [Ruminococcus sp.]|nr:TrkH family potassium uptake protein [Ruminococcus sp.]